MTQQNRRRLGAAFWGLLLLAGAIGLRGGTRSSVSPDAGGTSPAARIVDSFWSSTTAFQILDPTGIVSVGDVVFSQRSGIAREVGYVTAVPKTGRSPNTVTIAMFEPQEWSPTASFTVHRNSGRLGDVLATLMPNAKREELQAKLRVAFETHADEVSREILPLVLQSIRASGPLIESAIRDAVVRHDEEIQTLVSRYREELVREKLLPLVKQEVLPIVKKYGEEPAEAIGREIWDRASLFRFGWRAIYDKSPLPERELLAQEWQRFVDQEVVPIVDAHLDEIASAVENMLREIGANDRVREEFSQVVGTIAKDPQARDLFRVILRESIVDNEQLRRVWTDVWTSPEAKERLQRAGERIEPLLRELGDEFMGTREEGIEPGFARVLRNQILAKDRTWITININGPPPSLASPSRIPTLTPATRFSPYPVIYTVNGAVTH